MNPTVIVAITTFLLIGGAHAAAPLTEPILQPDAKNPYAALPAEAPASYPKEASLAVIKRWLDDEYRRLATEVYDKRMEGITLPPGACGGTISVMGTPSVLPIVEWRRLSRRCTKQIDAPDAQARTEALRFVSHLQQLAMGGQLQELLTAEMRAAVAGRTADPDASIRSLSLRVLSSFQYALPPAPTDVAFRAVIEALVAPDVATQRSAVLAVLFMTNSVEPEANGLGAFASHAIERLLPLASDSDRMTRLHAIQLLARTGDHTRELMPKFTAWLAGDDRLSRGAVYSSVRWLGANSGPLVPRLLEVATNPSDPEQGRAVSALGHVGSAGDQAVGRLTDLAYGVGGGKGEEHEDIIASLARGALARLGAVAAVAAPKLRVLAERDPFVAKECLWAAEVIEGKRKIEDPQD